MRTMTSRSTCVLAVVTIVFAAGCRDEVAVALDEVQVVQKEILGLLEQQVLTTAGSVAAARAAEKNAGIALENAGLVLYDHGNGWKNEAGGGSCSLFFRSDDPLCTAWREAKGEVRRANSTHEVAQTTVDNRAIRYAQELAEFRRAHDDDTWDLMGPPGASGRSIAIARLRELQDERTRLGNLGRDLHDERTRLENLAAESQP